MSLDAFLMTAGDEDFTFVAWNMPNIYFRQTQTQRKMESLVQLAFTVWSDQSRRESLPISFKRNVDPTPTFDEERARYEPEPISQFLHDTLIKKQRLLSRKDASYIALR